MASVLQWYRTGAEGNGMNLDITIPPTRKEDMSTPTPIDMFTRTINERLSIKLDIVRDNNHWYNHE